MLTFLNNFRSYTSVAIVVIRRVAMADNSEAIRSLALTPRWSVAIVLTIFVAVSLAVELSIHRLIYVSTLLTFKSSFLLTNFIEVSTGGTVL